MFHYALLFLWIYSQTKLDTTCTNLHILRISSQTFRHQMSDIFSLLPRLQGKIQIHYHMCVCVPLYNIWTSWLILSLLDTVHCIQQEAFPTEYICCYYSFVHWKVTYGKIWTRSHNVNHWYTPMGAKCPLIILWHLTVMKPQRMKAEVVQFLKNGHRIHVCVWERDRRTLNTGERYK